MNGRAKKIVIWVSVTFVLFLGFRFLIRLFGGFHHFGSGPQTYYINRGPGHGPGFEVHQHMIHGPHHGIGFSWIGTILFVFVVLAFGRFLFKKYLNNNNNQSFNQFVNEPSLTTLNAPVNRRNADLLDDWERNLTLNTKKENE